MNGGSLVAIMQQIKKIDKLNRWKQYFVEVTRVCFYLYLDKREREREKENKR